MFRGKHKKVKEKERKRKHITFRKGFTINRKDGEKMKSIIIVITLLIFYLLPKDNYLLYLYISLDLS